MCGLCCQKLGKQSISFSAIYSQSHISWVVQELVGLFFICEELLLMSASVWTTDDGINTTKLKGLMKNQDTKGSFFKFLDNLYI